MTIQTPLESESVPPDVRPAKIQIRLRECAFWIATDAKFLHADNEL